AEEFGDALFSMAVGDISEPVETSFGYHIIELEDIRDGGNDSFEEVADRLRVELAADAFFAASNEVDEQAFNNADSLQAAADSRGLEIKTLDGVGRLGGQGIAANQAVVAAAFSDEVLLDGLNSRAIEIADDHVVFLRVKNHNESQQRPLEEVRNIVQASLQAARAQELAEAKAEEALAQFESGTPFGALESAEEAIFNEAITARRTASGNLPAVVVQTAFSLAEPEGDAPALAITNLQGGDAAVVAVSNVSPGTISDDAARNAQLAQAEGVSDFQAYVNSLMEDASVSIRPDLLQ
ncbi:MAG: peptidyl-prolyl cis-trans isomerase, partial [Pseudomonadota bacterium]